MVPVLECVLLDFHVKTENTIQKNIYFQILIKIHILNFNINSCCRYLHILNKSYYILGGVSEFLYIFNVHNYHGLIKTAEIGVQIH